MNSAKSTVYVALVCILGLAASQTTRCSMSLRNGGVCVHKQQPCPTGTSEYAMYSNYIGCLRVDQKCCAYGTEEPVTNAGGIQPALPRTCGLGSLQPSDRILGGILTGVCDWPFVVSIRALSTDSSPLTYSGTSHACQGVLVDRQWVLTSPFCVLSAANTAQQAPSRMLVVAGEYNVSGIDIDPLTRQQQEQLINVHSVYIHPRYKYSSQDQLLPLNDTVGINSDAVALIRLNEPINGRCSGVACLPTAEEASNNCAAYEDCVITGWGFSTESFDQGPQDQLLMGRVRLSSEEACDFLTLRLGLVANRPRGTICQSPRIRNTDSCLGDEGGAVLCSNGDNWVVRGVLPFNTCVDGRYNIYVTEVAPYLDWIQSTMAAFGDGTQTRTG